MIDDIKIEKIKELLENRKNWGYITKRESIRESSSIICGVCEYLIGDTKDEKYLFFTSNDITCRSSDDIIKNVKRALVSLVGIDCSLENRFGVEGLSISL